MNKTSQIKGTRGFARFLIPFTNGASSIRNREGAERIERAIPFREIEHVLSSGERQSGWILRRRVIRKRREKLVRVRGREGGRGLEWETGRRRFARQWAWRLVRKFIISLRRCIGNRRVAPPPPPPRARYPPANIILKPKFSRKLLFIISPSSPSPHGGDPPRPKDKNVRGIFNRTSFIPASGVASPSATCSPCFPKLVGREYRKRRMGIRGELRMTLLRVDGESQIRDNGALLSPLPAFTLLVLHFFLTAVKTEERMLVSNFFFAN